MYYYSIANSHLICAIISEYIPDKNIWSTSQTNIARGSEYARLNGYKGEHNRIIIYKS